MYQALSSASLGVLQGGDIGSEEIHLLRQPALDDLVILVEPERHGFTGENLLAYPLLDQGVHLISRRRWPTLREPLHRQLAEVVLRQRDLIGSVGPVGGRVQQFVDREDQRARNKKMEQWFPQPPAYAR